MALDTTESLVETKYKKSLVAKGQLVFSVKTSHYLRTNFLENVGSSTSQNLIDLHGLLQGQLYLFIF
jgi:hypothetical protein